MELQTLSRRVNLLQDDEVVNCLTATNRYIEAGTQIRLGSAENRDFGNTSIEVRRVIVDDEEELSYYVRESDLDPIHTP